MKVDWNILVVFSVVVGVATSPGERKDVNADEGGDLTATEALSPTAEKPPSPPPPPPVVNVDKTPSPVEPTSGKPPAPNIEAVAPPSPPPAPPLPAPPVIKIEVSKSPAKSEAEPPPASGKPKQPQASAEKESETSAAGLKRPKKKKPQSELDVETTEIHSKIPKTKSRKDNPIAAELENKTPAAPVGEDEGEDLSFHESMGSETGDATKDFDPDVVEPDGTEKKTKQSVGGAKEKKKTRKPSATAAANIEFDAYADAGAGAESTGLSKKKPRKNQMPLEEQPEEEQPEIASDSETPTLGESETPQDEEVTPIDDGGMPVQDASRKRKKGGLKKGKTREKNMLCRNSGGCGRALEDEENVGSISVGDTELPNDEER